MRRLDSAIRLTLGFTWMSLCALILIPLTVLCLPWRGVRVRIGNYYGKVVGSVIAWLARAKVVIHDRDRLDGSFPAIYVSNHASMLDIFLGMWLCPAGGCGIAKKEVGRVPFFGWLYFLTGHLLIDRANRESAIAGLKGVTEAVRKYNLGVWMWPEGTRSRDGRLLPFKKGLGHLALATRLPIVPVIVHNAHKNWQKHTFAFTPVTVDVNVLPPIDTTGWTAEDLDARLEDVRAVFIQALGEEQRPLALAKEAS
ncbi:MAG: 1-acyl-sn-glycerol-3-phosphate acyltransferase [Deltaproteobacteria bacterium]|nr:1-acyl-sn-glycerol-3-phosphate acyltransferase [Deltaproteobacteria bacterium]